MSYDPAPDLAAISCPVLAISGRKDVQVDASDVERMRMLVTSPFTARTPADLTHLLRTSLRPTWACRLPDAARTPDGSRADRAGRHVDR